jgi:diketogulonate reductase-like aldo/keto reductase
MSAEAALSAGYALIDSASAYRNERDIAEALADQLDEGARGALVITKASRRTTAAPCRWAPWAS